MTQQLARRENVAAIERRPAGKVGFAQAMARLGIAYNREISAAYLSVAFDALSDIEHGDLEAAVGEAIRENKFFPAIAELRAYAIRHSKARASVEQAAQERAREAERARQQQQAAAVREAARQQLATFPTLKPADTAAEALRRLKVAAAADGRYWLVLGALQYADAVAFDGRTLTVALPMPSLCTEGLTAFGALIHIKVEAQERRG